MRVAAAGPLVLLALVTMALAGCTSSPPQAADTPEDVAPTGLTEPKLVPTNQTANVTQPADQSEFAKSLDEKFHVHDYWGGALEKTLMDVDVVSSDIVPDPLDLRQGAGIAISLLFGNAGETPFLLPQGSIVPPEADNVTVTVTWTHSPTITGLRLAYSTAADRAGWYTWMDPMPDGGGPNVIATNVTTNDIPHTTTSRWRFVLMPDSGGEVPFGPAVFNGTVHVLVKATRPDVLYVAPPHPDYWGNNTTLEVANVSGPFSGDRAVVPLFLLPNTGDGFAFFGPAEGTIVPPHTGLLTVTLTWTNNATLPDPFQAKLELFYWAPDSFDLVVPEQASAEPGKTVYTIPVSAAQWDSPYQNQSQWGFFVALDSDAPTDQGPFLGDVAFFDGDFRAAVVAEREQLA